MISLHDAEIALTKAGHEVIRCHEKRRAVNGEADELAIGSAPGFVLINCQAGVDYYSLCASCMEIADLPRVVTPSGGFHLYYRGDVQLPQVLATNKDGSPRITVTEYAVTFPTPGYSLESGLLTQIPAKPIEFWRQFKLAAAWQTVKPEQIVPIPGPAGDAPIVEPPPIDAQPPDDIAGAYAMMTLTERNVAQAFGEIYGERFRYCEGWGRWLEWRDSHWEVEETRLAFDFMVQIVHARNREMKPGPAKASFASGAEKIAKADRQFSTLTREWDRDSWLFNLPKGTSDMRTFETRAHVRSDYITKCARVSPAEGAHPIFDMFMRDICLADEALIHYHQRSLGACLSGAIQDNFLLFWYGTGQNGKNTFGDLVTWILGDYAKVIPIETLISNKNGQHPTTLANLRGLRLAVCSEVSEGSYWDEARVKSLTGDTEISARFMRQDFFEFPRTHKHLVYGNHRPMLRIVDPGMQARLHIVPFKAHFPPDARDPDMRRKLEAEAPQILSWLIAGHSQWLEDGYLKKCAAVQAETESYFEAQSTNEAWLTECCIEGADRYASARELYQSFKSWKEARGEGVISQNRWGEWMGQRFDKRRTGSGFVYQSVELKPQSVLDFKA